MTKIMELRGKRAEAWDAAKAFLDGKRGENGLISAEDNTTYERMETEVVNLGKEIERLERQQAMDLEMAKAVNTPLTGKPSADGETKTGRATNEYKMAFWNAMRNKNAYEAQNSLNIGVNEEGGYLVPDEFERTLIQALEDENIIRPIANVITSSSGERKIPVVATHGTASWVEEEGTIPESDDKFGVINLGAYKLATMLKISEELLNDSAFNMENYVAREFARRIGSAEEQAFLVGDGAGKPTGAFVTAETGVTVADAASVTIDDILDLYHSLREPYRRNAVFIMNDATVKSIRKLKDSSGQYLWAPSIKEGTPDTILNRPIKTSMYVPETGTGAKIVAFGDFSYYWISDRQGRAFKRLNELFAQNGQVGFLATQRVDGKLVLPEAVKVLQLQASSAPEAKKAAASTSATLKS